MLKQTQTENLLMVQKLSPRRVLLMKLLQLPTVMLEQRITEELVDNPALEIGDEGETDEDSSSEDNISDSEDTLSEREESPEQEQSGDIDNDCDLDEYFSDDYEDNYTSQPSHSNTTNSDQEDWNNYRESLQITKKSYQESLIEQLSFYPLNEQDKQMATFIIGCIDNSGYLTRTAKEIVNDLLFSLNIYTNEEHIVKLITNIVHHLDPAGSGAKDLRECLLLQLQRQAQSKAGDLAISILSNYFTDFAKKHFSKIKDYIKCSDKEFTEAVKLITNLSPKPGETSDDSSSDIYIIPDFQVIVNNKRGEVEVLMTAADTPNLRIRGKYKFMYKKLKEQAFRSEEERREAISFVRQKVMTAQWFIDALNQREYTLLQTMNSIVERQKAFFLSGDEKDLKPMFLRQIAEEISEDISTISRVVKQKYVQTPYGIFPLRFFFSSSMETMDGEEISSHEIKKIITDTINTENKSNPISDTDIHKKLLNSGYKVARRTVAKYREQMGFPVSRMRKQ